jgi:soluble lytic murein transglycosylase-like protein
VRPRKLFTRRAARRVAKRAAAHGVPKKTARHIAYAARVEELPYAIAFAMFEQESNFKVIYGHDAGGLLPGKPVTRDNYRLFRSIVSNGRGVGANGVGLGQVTYWTYIRDHRGLWKPKVQVYLDTSILADLVHRLGEFTGCGAYNGGEGNPNEEYAREVLMRSKRWRPLLAGERR